jgi:hypothetical protein
VYRRPRRRPYIGLIAAILAVAVVVAAVYGLVKLISGTPSLDTDAVHLPSSDPDSVFAWQNGALFIDKITLVCTDLSGKDLNTKLPAINMKAARVGNLTAAWGSGYVVILDENMQAKSMLNVTGDIVMAAPGQDYYAVVTKEENQHRLRVYNVKDSKQVDEELFPYQSVLGMGFFGDKLGQLWTLVVDSHGTEPVTKLTTYYPGKSTSGEIILNNEIGYAAFLQNKTTTYIAGTHTLSSWQQSVMKDNKLIYGWNLQDVLPEASGNISFLFAPSSADSSGLISALWYINTSGTEYRIPLPAGCFKAMLTEHGKICVATRNGVWSMAVNGSGSRFYPIARTVEAIPAVIPGKAFVMQEKHRNYLIMMP